VKTLIIAEAGVNHNGSLELAKKLVDAGAEAGVDVVKFQTFNPGALTSSYAPTAEYQKLNTGKDESQLEMLKKLTLSEKDHYELVDYCKIKGVQFCSSPFDLESIDFLKELGVPFWKIPSGEITNLPFLRKIANYNEPVIMSTGMSTLADVEAALEVFTSFGLSRDKITLLHCNTEYPTPAGDVNLNSMKTLGSSFGVAVGYSDHTEGIEFPITAVALGATVVEKHITLDKTMDGPDHKASLEPNELKAMVKAIRNVEMGLGSMVKAIRNVEMGLGSSIKKPSNSEMKNIAVARKSIVASMDIEKGLIFSEENISVKRPGTGLSPMLWDLIIGSAAKRDFKKDECIEIY